MDKHEWSRRAKRDAAQSTKAYFVNGEWDDRRALHKALQASIAQQQKDGPVNFSDSDSDAESYATANSSASTTLPIHKNHYDHYDDHFNTVGHKNSNKMKNGHKASHKNGHHHHHKHNGVSKSKDKNNNVKDELPAKTANDSSNGQVRRKIIKYSNRMDNKVRSSPIKSRVELPEHMFNNFIPEASDLFAFIKNTTIDELRSPSRCLPKFPARGLMMEDYKKMMANAGPPQKLHIPKTDEELPEIFKDYYRQHRKEYLLQKSDHESEAQWSSKSSTKENGHHIDEIVINSDDDSDVEFVEMEPLAPRLNKDHPNTNRKSPSKSNANGNKTISSPQKERKKPGRKPKKIKARDEKRSLAIKDTEAHKRADQFFASSEVKNRLKKAENRSGGKWAMPANGHQNHSNNSNNKHDHNNHHLNHNGNHNGNDDSESSSSSSDDELPMPPVKKRKQINRKSIITRSGTKRSMRKDKRTTF